MRVGPDFARAVACTCKADLVTDPNGLAVEILGTWFGMSPTLCAVVP
jgi:hypothetical protein